ncbi:MAG: D-tyrosyl-tRNA(Tyr) deacylase [Clostridia bacterium]|nr:D-tyrosyl-tRNA(Tyr) deacylase [Clostridia bacterium]
MRCVVQRVTSAAVQVGEETTGAIGPGIMALIGVSTEDGPADLKYIAEKVLHLRIFDDENGVMNKSILDAGGAILAVSQFTLYGDARGGRRPSYFRAAKPEKANEMYQQLIQTWRDAGVQVETGRFRAEMQVSLVNDGPVTILLDSEKNF